MPYTVAGTVTIAGVAAPNASNVVKIWADDGAGDGDLIDTVDIAGGAGAFTCNVPDNTRDYFAVYDDGTNRGVSALDTPSGSADWTIDATSLKGCPADLTEWTAVMSSAGLATGNPTSIWLCQDASGGLDDVTTTNNLGEFGTVSYQNVIAGWTRTAAGMADAASGAEFASTDASLPDPATTSILLILYIGIASAPAAGRTMLGLAQTDGFQIRLSTTPTPTLFQGANSQAGAENLGTTVRPHVIRLDQTANTNLYATDQEKLTCAFTSPSTKRIDIGGFDLAAPAMRIVYGVMFSGAAAELSDAQVKTLLEELGWSIPWS